MVNNLRPIWATRLILFLKLDILGSVTLRASPIELIRIYVRVNTHEIGLPKVLLKVGALFLEIAIEKSTLTLKHPGVIRH